MASLILRGMKTVDLVGDPWTSPDGKVTIWNVKLEDPSGEQGMYSTMSKAIAQVGFSGDLELYTNAKGKDYIRQAPKEEQATAVSNSWNESPEKQAHISRSVALNDAVLVATQLNLESPEQVLDVADTFYGWLVKTDSTALDAIKSVFDGDPGPSAEDM